VGRAATGKKYDKQDVTIEKRWRGKKGGQEKKGWETFPRWGGKLVEGQKKREKGRSVLVVTEQTKPLGGGKKTIKAKASNRRGRHRERGPQTTEKGKARTTGRSQESKMSSKTQTGP